MLKECPDDGSRKRPAEATWMVHQETPARLTDKRSLKDHARIPKSMIHDSWMRFQRKGWEGLVNEPRRPPHVIHRLPEAMIRRIVEVREKRGCFTKISSSSISSGLFNILCVEC